MFIDRKRRAVEQYLETTLPDQTDDLSYFVQEFPGSDTSLRTIYIRFKTPREAYLDLMQRLNAESYEKAEKPWHYMWPAEWQGLQNLAWWGLNLDTTADVFARASLDGGKWIRAKYDQGYAYIKLR